MNSLSGVLVALLILVFVLAPFILIALACYWMDAAIRIRERTWRFQVGEISRQEFEAFLTKYRRVQ